MATASAGAGAQRVGSMTHYRDDVTTLGALSSGRTPVEVAARTAVADTPTAEIDIRALFAQFPDESE